MDSMEARVFQLMSINCGGLIKMDVRIAAAPAIHNTRSENTRFNTAIYVSPTKKEVPYLV